MKKGEGTKRLRLAGARANKAKGSSEVWRVMAVDPGGTSGVVCFRGRLFDGDVGRAVVEAEALDWYEVKGGELDQGRQLALLWEKFGMHWNVGGRAIVIEDFILRSNVRAREVLSPVRVTAAMLGHLSCSCGGAENRLWVAPAVQTPSQAKTFATDERLRRWGLWIPGSGHARDAARHLALWIRGRE